MRIKTGLVGYGLGGRCFHAPFIHALPTFELAAVLERHHNQSALDYPGVKIVRTMDEMLADPSISLVVITTPNETHYGYARQALQAGKMVVVDKPMTVTSEESKSLIQISKETGKLLSVYQSRRYASDALTIRKILSKKMLGNVHEFEAHYNRYRPQARDSWKESEAAGSGILYDLGPHLIDQALQLFGLPERIFAEIRQQRSHARTDDFFDIRLYFPHTRAILKAGMLVREDGPRYQVHGDLGSFIKYGDDPQDAALRAGKKPGTPGWGEEPPEFYGLLHTEWQGKIIRENIPSEAGNFGLFYENLYNRIVNKTPLSEKPEHGYNVVRVIELARASHAQNCSIPCTGLMHTA